MVRQLMPAAGPAEIRHLLASLQSADQDGDGKVSYPELLRAMRLMRVVRVRAGKGEGAFSGWGSQPEVGTGRIIPFFSRARGSLYSRNEGFGGEGV